MLAIIALLSCLFQGGGTVPPPGGAAPPHTTVDCTWCAEARPSATDSHSVEQAEEQELVQRFNRLVNALTDFSHAYNSKGVIDVKTVKAVRKALREFEKSEWFSQKDERRALR
jgi:hypothetical protein